MLEGHKGIADHVSKRIGRPFTVDAARAAARRTDDPLPTECFNGRVAAAEEKVDAWVARQAGRKLRSKSAEKAA